MAKRRMFSPRVTETSNFFMLSVTAQLLYFHMGMVADDDGFADCYSIVRSIDVRGNEFNELVTHGFIKLVPDRPYVCYICDWLENNNIRADRYRESIYHDLLPEMRTDDKIYKFG